MELEPKLDVMQQKQGISLNLVTFISILKACGTIGAIGKGKQVHEHIVNRGLLEKDTVLSSALVDMYAKCGLLAQARQVLERIPGDMYAKCGLVCKRVRDVLEDLPTQNVVT